MSIVGYIRDRKWTKGGGKYGNGEMKKNHQKEKNRKRAYGCLG